MNRRYHGIRRIVAALLAVCATVSMTWASAQEQRPTGRDDDIEILTRGPVHEAFAETVTFDPEAGLVTPKTPPSAIEELPPEHQPEGDNMSWIPGYWAWDDDREDFLWVSGIWRALPPGRQWVPGYWARSGQGAQWTSGYWADAKTEEVEYLPEPPATVEVGPNTPAPSEDQNWMPGSWLWLENRYAWRPGYWAPGQDNWSWVPAHYVWTPRGYVFVDGYFDHTVERRGVLFAPIYFHSNVYAQRGYSYSPVTAINPAVFTNHLFLRPNYGHYYFGDYYGANYTTRGFSPWFSFHGNHAGYDPFYAQQRWQNRNDQQWNRRLESEYARRRDNEDARPPRTWRSQRDWIEKQAASIDENNRVGRSYDELIKDKDIPRRFQPLAPEDRQRIGKRRQEIRSAYEQRQTLESQAVDRSAGPPKQTGTAVRVRLPKSTIVGLPMEKLDKSQAPPRVIEPPRPEPKVQPQPRKPRGERGTPPAGEKKVKDDNKGKGQEKRGAG